MRLERRVSRLGTSEIKTVRPEERQGDFYVHGEDGVPETLPNRKWVNTCTEEGST